MNTPEYTGTLDVVESGREVKRYQWNGKVEDQERARAAFNEAKAMGGFATVKESPGRARQIKSFDDVVEHEKRTGTVEATIGPAIVGG